jgi:hypothetical protein
MQLRTFELTLTVFVMFAGFCSSQTSPTPTPESGTGIEGVITLSPTHPGPVRPGMISSKPLANATFVAANEKGTATEFTTDSEGHFRISLAPGHYTVSLKDKKGGIGRYGPFDVDVAAGPMTKVEWQCDTGMR